MAISAMSRAIRMRGNFTPPSPVLQAVQSISPPLHGTHTPILLVRPHRAGHLAQMASQTATGPALLRVVTDALSDGEVRARAHDAPDMAGVGPRRSHDRSRRIAWMASSSLDRNRERSALAK